MLVGLLLLQFRVAARDVQAGVLAARVAVVAAFVALHHPVATPRQSAQIGAGIGAVAGAGIGAYMDAQERKLREETAGTGVDVIRDGDNLLLRMPSGITFGYDRADVQPQFQPTLNDVASVLAQYPKTYIDVYGHTDSDGSDAYNQTLSERRAQAVANYLVGRGVQSARIGTRGFGETQPIASNATEEGKAANRRVEIKIAPVTEADVRN